MKKLGLAILLLNVCLLNAQNLGWFKQYFGHGMSVVNQSISTNANGEIANCGIFNRTSAGSQFVDFDPSAATYSLTATAGPSIVNCWVTKLDATGNLIWARAFDVNTNGSGKATTKINNSGEVVVGSMFYWIGDFDPNITTYTMTTNTNPTSFITKLDAAGNFAWAMQFRQVSGAARATISDIEVDNLNNIYASGYFVGSIDFDPSVLTYSIDGGSYPSSFIAKYDNSGQFLWVKTSNSLYGSTQTVAMTLDKNKNILITGIYNGTVDFDPSAATYTLNSINFAPYGEPYIQKLDSNGLFIWAKQFADGISFHNNGTPVSDIGIDNNNDVYITGATKDSLDFDPSAAKYYLKSKGQEDVYAVKLSATGNFVWAKMFNGDWSDNSSSIQLDKSNNDVYIAFNFKSLNLDVDPGVLTNTVSAIAVTSMLINRLNTNGNYIANYYFNSNSNSANNIGDMVMDKNNDLIVSGDFSLAYFTGSMWVDFDPGVGVVKGVDTYGYNDGFVLKLNNLSTGLNEQKLNNSFFKLYPNPTSTILNIEVDSYNSNSQIIITDILGQTILSQKIESTKTVINTTNDYKGIYFVTLVNGENTSTQKIIVQ